MLEQIEIIKTIDVCYHIAGYTKLAGVPDYLLTQALNVDIYPEAIYLCRVVKMNFGNKTAFVEIGQTGLSGFINLTIMHKLQVGSIIPLQVRHLGVANKQIKLSTRLNLIGKYTVFDIFGKSGHKFYCNQELQIQLQQLSDKYQHHAILFRTNIESTLYPHKSSHCEPCKSTAWQSSLSSQRMLSSSEQTRESTNDILIAIEKEIQFMLLKKEQIKASLNNPVNSCIYGGVPLYSRFIRDSSLLPTCKINTNCKKAYQQISSDLPYLDLDVAFDTNYLSQLTDLTVSQYQTQVKKAHFTLEINQVSGIHIIDINSSSSSLAFFKVNYLALDEILHQIKFRDLTGIIILDLIKNMTDKQKQTILDKLVKGFAADFRNTKIMGFTNAQLVEIIRMR
jgi:hypothetical protein